MGKKEKANKKPEGADSNEGKGKGKETAPGQLKKVAGEKSAKSFAPGQKKKSG